MSYLNQYDFCKEKYSTHFKASVIKPIYKRGSRSEVENFIPNSLNI